MIYLNTENVEINPKPRSVRKCLFKKVENILKSQGMRAVGKKRALFKNFRKSFKNILNCCKVQIVFKSQRRLSSQFHFKEPLPYDLMSKVVYVWKMQFFVLR